MINDDPKLVIRNLISDNWDSNETTYRDTPRIHTGWYDRNSGGPQVTVTNTEETTVNGGQTGNTGLRNSGGVSQVRAGSVLVNSWSGTRDDLSGQAWDFEDINPKKLSFEMAKLVHDLIQDHANGVIGGEVIFGTLGTGQIRNIPETEDEFISRYEITVNYTYVN